MPMEYRYKIASYKVDVYPWDAENRNPSSITCVCYYEKKPTITIICLFSDQTPPFNKYNTQNFDYKGNKQGMYFPREYFSVLFEMLQSPDCRFQRGDEAHDTYFCISAEDEWFAKYQSLQTSAGVIKNVIKK